MTADSNVLVTVTDPDRLMAGTSPMAPFVVNFLRLYRYVSEAAARADTNGSGGTLVVKWTLVASSTTVASPNIAGPFRWGTYDASQTADSWYRYLFADFGETVISLLSEPWQSDDRDSWALRDILFESGELLGGGAVKQGTATGGTTSTVTCATIFKSTLRDATFYDGWTLMVTKKAATPGAAPEGEEALIASVDTSAGVATLERPLSVAVANGDTFLISAFINPSEMVNIINRCREEMQLLQWVDVALSGDENRYPAPPSIKADTDIIRAYGIRQQLSNREDEWELDVQVQSDGLRQWMTTNEDPSSVSPVIRLQVVRSWRDFEGKLSAMGDTTIQNIEWMRPCFAWAYASWLWEADENEAEFKAMVDQLTKKAAAASGRWAPQFVRPIKGGAGGRKLLPGPAWVS